MVFLYNSKDFLVYNNTVYNLKYVLKTTRINNMKRLK